VSPSRSRRRLRAALFAALAPALACGVLLPAAPAAAGAPAASASERTRAPETFPERPDDYAIGAREALRVADRDPLVAAEKARRDSPLTASVEAEAVRRWEVGYFDGEQKVVLIVVDGVSGEVAESWTGDQVSWPMARGREGQFGHLLNAPWIWIPLAGVFLAGLVDWRRLRRIAHLDLLVLLSFGISQAYFNAAEIGISVPLAYPPLIYLLARMLWIGFGRRSAPLRPRAPLTLLVVACVLLAVFRVTLNVADSGVIDVGYAGVIGADRIVDAEPIYGDAAFPADNPTGDTYAPANYFAYVPFEQALPWSGSWDDLPAAHAAAIFFDLLCVAGLFVLGRRLARSRGDADDPDDAAATKAGNRLGVILAFAWLAYPYTDFVLQSSSNDSLPAALLIWSLVAFAQPLARGALLGVAAMCKFAPLALAPLYLAGGRGLWHRSGREGRLRGALLFAGGFAAALALMLAHPAIDPGLATFWERTIGSQAGRASPFSAWGQADLEWLQTLVKLAVVALALGVALWPARRSLVQVAALAAAVTIAVQLTAEHWFYLYIVWFLPMLLVAIATPARPRADEEDPPPELPGTGLDRGTLPSATR
jgi:hypothetical protein